MWFKKKKKVREKVNPITTELMTKLFVADDWRYVYVKDQTSRQTRYQSNHFEKTVHIAVSTASVKMAIHVGNVIVYFGSTIKELERHCDKCAKENHMADAKAAIDSL
jgi:hypothetical protein